MNGKVNTSYVRSAILYESKTWCLRENEVAILRRAERSMVKAMCSVKFVDKRRRVRILVELSQEFQSLWTTARS